MNFKSFKNYSYQFLMATNSQKLLVQNNNENNQKKFFELLNSSLSSIIQNKNNYVFRSESGHDTNVLSSSRSYYCCNYFRLWDRGRIYASNQEQSLKKGISTTPILVGAFVDVSSYSGKTMIISAATSVISVILNVILPTSDISLPLFSKDVVFHSESRVQSLLTSSVSLDYKKSACLQEYTVNVACCVNGYIVSGKSKDTLLVQMSYMSAGDDKKEDFAATGTTLSAGNLVLNNIIKEICFVTADVSQNVSCANGATPTLEDSVEMCSIFDILVSPIESIGVSVQTTFGEATSMFLDVIPSENFRLVSMLYHHSIRQNMLSSTQFMKASKVRMKSLVSGYGKHRLIWEKGKLNEIIYLKCFCPELRKNSSSINEHSSVSNLVNKVTWCVLIDGCKRNSDVASKFMALLSSSTTPSYGAQVQVLLLFFTLWWLGNQCLKLKKYMLEDSLSKFKLFKEV